VQTWSIMRMFRCKLMIFDWLHSFCWDPRIGQQAPRKRAEYTIPPTAGSETGIAFPHSSDFQNLKGWKCPERPVIHFQQSPACVRRKPNWLSHHLWRLERKPTLPAAIWQSAVQHWHKCPTSECESFWDRGAQSKGSSFQKNKVCLNLQSTDATIAVLASPEQSSTWSEVGPHPKGVDKS
jgi:hypothetical protein